MTLGMSEQTVGPLKASSVGFHHIHPEFTQNTSKSLLFSKLYKCKQLANSIVNKTSKIWMRLLTSPKPVINKVKITLAMHITGLMWICTVPFLWVTTPQLRSHYLGFTEEKRFNKQSLYRNNRSLNFLAIVKNKHEQKEYKLTLKASPV